MDFFGSAPTVPDINPANGLPMIDDAGIDIAGNPYGTDGFDDDLLNSSSSALDDDLFSSSSNW